QARKKPPIRVGDEDKEEKQPPAAPRVNADLEKEAARAEHPALRQLFQSLAQPHDVLTMFQTGRTLKTAPYKEYIGTPAEFRGEITLQLLNDEFKPQRNPLKYKSTDIRGLEPYESLAAAKVRAFLESGLDKPVDGGPPALRRADMVQ